MLEQIDKILNQMTLTIKQSIITSVIRLFAQFTQMSTEPSNT